MRRRRSLGLDELMIVNPGRPGARVAFLAAHGRLVPVRGLGAPARLFLAADGSLYRLHGLGSNECAEPPRYFLGEDGTLYEVLRP
jgi:hypothetical protein